MNRSSDNKSNTNRNIELSEYFHLFRRKSLFFLQCYRYQRNWNGRKTKRGYLCGQPRFENPITDYPLIACSQAAFNCFAVALFGS